MGEIRECSVGSCGRAVTSKGLCNMHYCRVRTHGEAGEAAPRKVRSATGKCSYPECERKHHANSYCSVHNAQIYRGAALGEIKARPLANATAQVKIEALTKRVGDCLEWVGQKSRGYGIVFVDGKKWFAHRLAYQVKNGIIDDGFEIDHKCRNRACVNAEHLHAVTRVENAQNISLQANNTSGYRGVVRTVTRKGTVRYAAKANANGITYRGGMFDTPEEANIAAIALRNRFQTNNREDWNERSDK